jgi:uncharacterized membrane protein YraQ (UPF0718 family)
MIAKLLRTHWLLVGTALLYIWAFIFSPERATRALGDGMSVFLTVCVLILAVFCLIGLLQVWIGRDRIVHALGHESGFKGLLLAVLCGTLLLGPPYVIFPLLYEIKRQGARWAVISTVLTCYAIKVQMLPVEAGFLGWPFTMARTFITLLIAIPVALLIEFIMERIEARR